MFDRLEEVEKRYEEISQRLYDPQVIADQEEYKSLMREHKQLTPIVEAYRDYKKASENCAQAKAMMGDSLLEKEFRELAEEEWAQSKADMERIAEELKVLLLPHDPNDDKNVIVEIRGGAGGEEAALFSAALFRMYSMYAEQRGWKTEVISANETELGGYKEISFLISGEGAYSRLKFESGVHRVQRVPETVELDLNPADLQIDTFRASGAGGQHINKTESAIRITHIPTGIVVECQDERSQYKNKDKALKLIKAKILDGKRAEQENAIAAERKAQVGTGDRSERIRTYNYPQSRITDHRIGLTLYKLESVLNGDLDEVIDALITADRAEKLKASGEE